MQPAVIVVQQRAKALCPAVVKHGDLESFKLLKEPAMAALIKSLNIATTPARHCSAAGAEVSTSTMILSTAGVLGQSRSCQTLSLSPCTTTPAAGKACGKSRDGLFMHCQLHPDS